MGWPPVAVLAQIVLAQVDITEAPTTVAAALMLFIILLLTDRLHTPGDFNRQVTRGDKLQEALDAERAASAELRAALNDRAEVDQVLRRVLEALPQIERTPPPPPPPRAPPRESPRGPRAPERPTEGGRR